VARNLEIGFSNGTTARESLPLEQTGEPVENEALVSLLSTSNGGTNASQRDGDGLEIAKRTPDGWFHGMQAARIRSILHSRIFEAVMFIALFASLFFPDILVLCDLDSNVVGDTMMFLVMTFFFLEMIGMMLSDERYTFSFAHMMDFVGTASLMFDVSFLCGKDATVAQHFKSKSKGMEQHMSMRVALLRSTRTARIGIRALRLSRIARILRFMPGRSQAVSGRNNNETMETKGISFAISSHLANVLESRLVALTIALVMVIPLFDLMQFPQDSYALQAWVDRLVADASNWTLGDPASKRTIKQLSQMAEFYDERCYGPYEVCMGHTTTEGLFVCEDVVHGWNPQIEEPSRGASKLLVYGSTVQIAFNVTWPSMVNSLLGITNICFIMLIMVFSSLALSNDVTDLTVRPLERLLITVRQIASTVFKLSAEVFDEHQLLLDMEEEANENIDIDNTGEMILLEKVVQKLAVLVDLQMTQDGHQLVTDDMNQDDIAVISWLHGQNPLEQADHSLSRNMSRAPKKQKKFIKGAKQTLNFAAHGVTQDVYHSFDFATLDLERLQLINLGVWTVSKFAEQGEGFVITDQDNAVLNKFVSILEAAYQPNIFHNFAHAVDVLHGASRIMRLTQSDLFLSELEQFALLIASISHDVGHPGVNNGFLSETYHELALQYNDQSPLENMHCSKLYGIVQQSEANVFARLTRDQYKEVRKHCIDGILHTDMMCHNAMVKELQGILTANAEVFISRADGMNTSRRSRGSSRDNSADNSPDKSSGGEGASGVGSGPEGVDALSTDEVALFQKPEYKSVMIAMVVHSADVSNPCRTFDVTLAWGMKMLEEFAAQGDLEKSLGVPVQFLNDRDKLNKPASQIGFIELMIAPLFTVLMRLWPRLSCYGDNLGNNTQSWEKRWLESTQASDEEKQKLKSRVEAVKTSLDLGSRRERISQ
jgi:hypothetical protein